MDQLIKEMGNIRIQFQDMKKETEVVKGQLEDTKTELNETKIQLEEFKIQIKETKIQLQNTKTELLNETKIQLEESKIQLDESKIQLDESKIQLDESKIQIEETKIQLQNTKTEMNETKIQLEDAKTQLDEFKIQLDVSKIQLDVSKIQLDQSKIQREDCMVQLEESKTKISELGETLKNIEELGKTNSKDILANSMNMTPLLEWLEYAKNPCWNCNGPVYCLFGKEIVTRPMDGTWIRTNKKYRGKDEYGNLKVVGIYSAGVVTSSSTIFWVECEGETYDDADFCQFVYNCHLIWFYKPSFIISFFTFDTNTAIVLFLYRWQDLFLNILTDTCIHSYALFSSWHCCWNVSYFFLNRFYSSVSILFLELRIYLSQELSRLVWFFIAFWWNLIFLTF